ncbi:DNA methylase [Mycobacteroides abscessus subsp. abscessus]|nr:class I SAM-dependent methyltransferase [Mycobacteroides abscessus]SHR21559.1 DNA methylase [Mycobacteroides abscessus subsp. abscessus]SHV82099.1 DNA methylase [Mycobacteroides abscessus subsp. abscessus]SHV86193.1 DNA methylase [Mycobacteroides abscessus subsp. abscessus]SHW36211.1 DNA methylase [Mycobacteroides abscessus subsp. abscessus]SHW53393.1 DNA methylase [Mycobacteroides abscessus subsp. abscessus]
MTDLALFDVPSRTPTVLDRSKAVRALGQFPTPAWAAEALVRQHLSDLGGTDFVLEPTCGAGRFLAAIPPHIDAIGVEIDPVLAEQARALTGRQVITGDIRVVDVPTRPTVVLGNPPFETKLIEQILQKVHGLLVADGRVCFVLPAFFFQTARRVVRYSEQWSIRQECLPRNLYHGLKHPLVFAEFTKDQRRVLVGFSLFHEMAFLQALPKPIREAVDAGPMTWPAIVRKAIDEHGGTASLAEIYDYVADRRPTQNPAWREQVRKVCQLHTQRISRGRYTVRGASQNN